MALIFSHLVVVAVIKDVGVALKILSACYIVRAGIDSVRLILNSDKGNV